MRIHTTKVVEVPASVVPKPYKYHQVDPTAMGPHKTVYYELGVNVQY